MQFSADDFVVHPVYGVGQITKIEEKQFSELEACVYYQITFPNSNIWAPITSQAAIGLRLVTAKEELDAYRDLIKSSPDLLDGNLSKWHEELAGRLQDGSFQTICEVVRDLTISGKHKPLNTTARAILRKTQEKLYQEWATAADISVAEATQEIDGLLQATIDELE